MRNRAFVSLLGLLVACSTSEPSAKKLGSEEFGLSPKELTESIEKVEGLIAECMQEEGFEYIAADYMTECYIA